MFYSMPKVCLTTPSKLVCSGGLVHRCQVSFCNFLVGAKQLWTSSDVFSLNNEHLFLAEMEEVQVEAEPQW